MEQTKEKFWSQYANNFDELNNYVVGKNDVDRMKSRLSGIKNLCNMLELACGNGTYTKVMIDNALHITATDFSEEMVKVATKSLSEYKNIKVEQANAMQLHYDNEIFDSVFMANLIHVVPDCTKVVQEAKRILKPKGNIIVLDYTMSGMNIFNKIGMIYRFMKTYGKPTEEAEKSKFSIKEMENLLQNNGFEILESELLGKKSKAVFVVAQKNN